MVANTITNNGVKYIRVNKTVARRLHNEGVNIFVNACNIPAFSPWGGEVVLTASDDFNKFIDAFIYYNCRYATGYYPCYYVAQ